MTPIISFYFLCHFSCPNASENMTEGLYFDVLISGKMTLRVGKCKKMTGPDSEPVKYFKNDNCVK